ncbi:MAG: sulfatase-like hydrolase/transferase [Phycisphaerales bacterium]|nr:MAG: sulfatase-like hydrolase/transferase [Phycisphaerales bacterium]
MFNRRNFLKVTGVSAAGLLTQCSFKKQRKPNILFVLTDQQTWRAMSCACNPHLSTPAMDRLAAEGVRFEQAYCTSPVCGPARSSLITSRMPQEAGVEWNGDSIKAGIPTLGHIFREHGYSTVWAGKWHLPESYPLRAGSKRKKIDGFEVLPFYDSTKNYPEWGYGHVTDEPLAEAAADFLRQAQDKPFLVGVSFCNPHDCCYLTRRPERYPDAGAIDGLLPPLPPNYAIAADESEFTKQRRYEIDHYGDEVLLSKDWGEPQWRAYLWNYYRMTERVDAALGNVLKALDDSGLTDDTLVLFTSDHGDGVGSHRWTAKLSLYEEPTRIPMLIRWPGRIPAGKTDTGHLVSQLDVLPTFCQYADISPLPSFRGRSLKSIIDNPKAPWRDFVVTELADDKLDRSRKGRMIRTTQYKYNIYSSGARNEQLFDLKYDPGETQNLVCEPSMRAIVNRHGDLLRTWMRETGDTSCRTISELLNADLERKQ